MPIFAVPDGITTLVEASAVPMSNAESPFAYSAAGFKLTITDRFTPPSGAGDENPGIVNSCTRIKFNP